MSIGGRFHLAPALILGSLWKAGKARAFGRRLDDDPVTKVKLFLLQILHGNMACASSRDFRMDRFPWPGIAKLRRLLLTIFEILFYQV